MRLHASCSCSVSSKTLNDTNNPNTSLFNENYLFMLTIIITTYWVMPLLKNVVISRCLLSGI